MSWILSGTSILMLWLMGNKSKWGPAVGLLSQSLWFYYVAITEQWGLMPGVIVYTMVHIRNLRKWRSEF